MKLTRSKPRYATRVEIILVASLTILIASVGILLYANRTAEICGVANTLTEDVRALAASANDGIRSVEPGTSLTRAQHAVIEARREMRRNLKTREIDCNW